MRRVLIIAYYFPPVGGGGVQRAVKMVRYLPEFGYQPVVLTGAGETADRWAPRDASLAGEIGDGIEVHRVPGPEPKISTGWRWRAERFLFVRSPFDEWWANGVERLGTTLGAGVDAIVGECVPYTTGEPSARVSRATGRPWIADFQDPWALDEMWLYPSAVHRLKDRQRMRTVLGSAAAVVMNTPEAVARVHGAFPELEQRRVVSIPNGFDAADFAGDRPERSDGAFRIVHTGYLHTERAAETSRLRHALGGMPVPGVDFLARSHVYVIQAIQRAIARAPGLADAVELHLAGVLAPADIQVIVDVPFVRTHGYVDHAETVALQRSADLLFLPMQDLPDGVRAGLVPGKTYEYLAARRRILAAVPEGDARDLLLEAGNAFVCGPRDVHQMSELILEAYEQWRTGEPQPAPDENVLARYERRAQAGALASLLDEVLAASATPKVRTREETRT